MPDTQPLTQRRVDPQLIYRTIREEIIDQKGCQFQLLSLAVTVTAGVLAYGTATAAAPPIYLAPLIMNAVPVIIIFDKAVSIQRKVSYLQIMEGQFAEHAWMWESQLDQLRKAVPATGGLQEDTSRKYSYVTTVGSMLVPLNVLFMFLFATAPGASRRHRESSRWLSLATTFVLVIVFLFGAIAFWLKRGQLVRGRRSGPQICRTSKTVLVKWPRNEEWQDSYGTGRASIAQPDDALRFRGWMTAPVTTGRRGKSQ